MDGRNMIADCLHYLIVYSVLASSRPRLRSLSLFRAVSDRGQESQVSLSDLSAQEVEKKVSELLARG
jgi:hypothetical protein